MKYRGELCGYQFCPLMESNYKFLITDFLFTPLIKGTRTIVKLRLLRKYLVEDTVKELIQNNLIILIRIVNLDILRDT